MGFEPIIFGVTGRCFNRIKPYFLKKLIYDANTKKGSRTLINLEPKPSMSTIPSFWQTKFNVNHPTNKPKEIKITKLHRQNANTKPQTQSQNDGLRYSDLK